MGELKAPWLPIERWKARPPGRARHDRASPVPPASLVLRPFETSSPRPATRPRCDEPRYESETEEEDEIDMAKKKQRRRRRSAASTASQAAAPVQQPPAEERFADQLAFLRAVDTSSRPQGWLLSPERVVDFLCGTHGNRFEHRVRPIAAGASRSMVIEPKFVARRALIERCVGDVGRREGLLLVGQPAPPRACRQSWPRRSRTSALTIQARRRVRRPSALRLELRHAARRGEPEGARPRRVLTGMRTVRLVRIEEITRCLPEVQDALIAC